MQAGHVDQIFLKCNFFFNKIEIVGSFLIAHSEGGKGSNQLTADQAYGHQQATGLRYRYDRDSFLSTTCPLNQSEALDNERCFCFSCTCFHFE